MRIIKRTVPLLSVLLLLALVTACAPAATPAPTAVPPTPTALSLPPTAESTTALATAAPGEITDASLYQLSCAACHGQDHSGNTFDMDGQKISVPSLDWTELSGTYAADPSRGSVNDQVAISIVKGLDETGGDLNAMMPRWSSLSQGQVNSLVQYLQTAGTSEPSALSPDAAALQGEQLYQAACAACHGTDGAGKTFEKEDNKIETPSLSWAELSQTYSAAPSRGTVAEQVALSIVKGQDETGGDLNSMMPRWLFLSNEQVDSLVQYLQSTFK